MITNVKTNGVFAFSIIILLVFLFIILNSTIEKSEFQIQVDQLFKVQIFETPKLYFIHHVLCFIPVFILSITLPFFTTRFQFIRDWWKPILVSSIIYCIWDLIFSNLGIWGFNKNYILGIELSGFPLEEILWFPIIAYCSIYIYAIRTRIKSSEYNYLLGKVLTIIFGLIMLLLFIINYTELYTSFSSWVGLSIILLYYIFKKQEQLYTFSLSFLIIMIPMILADGLLTGMFTLEPVIIYNSQEFSGIRLISIPIEDFSFGYSFLGATIFLKNAFK